jgi:hypothetical protein
MTRKQCLEILKDKNHPQHQSLHHTYYTNMNSARKHFRELGLYKSGMVLHHCYPGCTNYEEWNINDLLPMTSEEHTRLHKKARFVSQETRERNRQAVLRTRNFDIMNQKNREKNIALWQDPQYHEEWRKRIASKIGKKIICVETQEEFDSMHHAEVQLKIFHIARAIQNQSTAGGFHWSYKN